MKKSEYKSYDDLPLFLNADTVAKVLGVSPSSGYELMHEPGFPVLRIGNRMVVPQRAVHPVGERAHRRRRMRYSKYSGRGNFFSLPNEVFLLGLSAGELSVYSFLKRCENRKTHQCWPSIKTIGQAVRMSENTVRKYIRQLEERGLIVTEPTEVITKTGEKRNGNLLFTLRPIQEVIDQYYDRQLEELELATERQRVANLLRKQ